MPWVKGMPRLPLLLLFGSIGDGSTTIREWANNGPGVPTVYGGRESGCFPDRSIASTRRPFPVAGPVHFFWSLGAGGWKAWAPHILQKKSPITWKLLRPKNAWSHEINHTLCRSE